MNVTLLNCSSENNSLNKIFAAARVEISGALLEESSVMTPTLRIQAANISNYNYMYVEEFGRYYYITDIISVRNGLWLVRGRCDVLYTYRVQIKNLEAILEKTESTAENDYVSDSVWTASVKDKTDILPFQHGLLDSGEFILITAGG